MRGDRARQTAAQRALHLQFTGAADAKGYVTAPADNLLDGVSLALFEEDLRSGDGSEIEDLACAGEDVTADSVVAVTGLAAQYDFMRVSNMIVRAFDRAKSGSGVGGAVLLALCSSLLQKSIKGGLAVTDGLNLGGSLETIFNPVAVVETAIEKGAASILMPISSRRQLNDLPDDQAARITVHYYLDARDALLKALAV